MAVTVEYRTLSVENLSDQTFWYEGDNEDSYDSVEDAILRSDTIAAWREGQPTSLTVVRVRDLGTGRATYISPNPSR